MKKTSKHRSKTRKQAVVVIHGMGEQRPMETMREFVDAVWNGDQSLNSKPDALKTWIAPDIGDGNTELMRITTDWHECHLPGEGSSSGDKVNRARTDFFEFYWADIFADSRLSMLTPWVQSLFFRLPNRVPLSVVAIWIAMWAILLLLIAGFVQAVMAAIFSPDITGHSGYFFVLLAARQVVLFVGGELFFPYSLVGMVALIIAILATVVWPRRGNKPVMSQFAATWRFCLMFVVAVILLLASAKFLAELAQEEISSGSAMMLSVPMNVIFCLLMLYLLNRLIIPYFGDVARYLHTSPNTVAKREEIRKRGLILLRRLHDNDAYERIVIVSHSLGTVIAYDLIRILWSEYGPTSANHPLTKEQIKRFQDVSTAALSMPKTRNSDRPEEWVRNDVLNYRQAQKEAFAALQNHGGLSADNHEKKPKQWKISDFVTCGSPLTHARFLVAPTKKRLESLVNERTLPVCPPLQEIGNNRYRDKAGSGTYLYQSGRGTSKATYVHHAAPFAVVRWTNIYDWRFLGLFGDFVSGPLRQIFGSGVADYHVRLYRRFVSWLSRLVTHTLYWKSKTALSHPVGDSKKLTMNLAPYHVALLRAAVDMRFCRDDLADFLPGKPAEYPLAGLLRIAAWALIAVGSTWIVFAALRYLFS